MPESIFNPPTPPKKNWVKTAIIVVVAGIVAYAAWGCAPAMKQARLAQHDLTTPSMVGVAAADSTATALGYKTSKSPAEQEFLLKMAKINADRDVGVATAQAKAAAFALLMQRYANGFGSNAMGTVNQYNPPRCAPPWC